MRCHVLEKNRHAILAHHCLFHRFPMVNCSRGLITGRVALSNGSIAKINLEQFNFASSGFKSTSCHCFPLYSPEAVQIAARKSTAWGLSTTPKQWHRKTQGETALATRFIQFRQCHIACLPPQVRFTWAVDLLLIFGVAIHFRLVVVGHLVVWPDVKIITPFLAVLETDKVDRLRDRQQCRTPLVTT